MDNHRRPERLWIAFGKVHDITGQVAVRRFVRGLIYMQVRADDISVSPEISCPAQERAECGTRHVRMPEPRFDSGFDLVTQLNNRIQRYVIELTPFVMGNPLGYDSKTLDNLFLAVDANAPAARNVRAKISVFIRHLAPLSHR